MTDAEKRVKYFDARHEYLSQLIREMPPAAAEHFGRWRRAVEFVGRADNGGQLNQVVAFAESVAELVRALGPPAALPEPMPLPEGEPPPAKVAGAYAPGPVVS